MSSGRDQRPAEQVALLGFDRLEPRRGGGCGLQRGDRARVGIEGRDAGALREPQREWPDAAKQIGHVFGLADMAADEPRKRLFACRGRLQERARRQSDPRAAHRHRRRAALRDQLAMPGEPREPMLFGDARQRAHPRGVERAGAAHVHVEAGVGRGHLDVERLSLAARALRRPPRRP